MLEHNTQKFVERGDRLLGSSELTAALAVYDAALDMNPADVAALVRAGTVLLDLGDFRAAWRHFGQAAAGAPEDAGVHWLLGLAALSAGEGDSARAALLRARERGADSPEIALDLALASYLALDLGAARSHVDAVLSELPAHAEALAWREKLDALGTDQAFLIDVGRAHCREGRFEEGIDLLYAALVYGESYDAHLYLGRAHLALGDGGNALPHLEAAEAMRSGDEAALRGAADARMLSAAFGNEEDEEQESAETRVSTRVVSGPLLCAPVVSVLCARCGASMPTEAAACGLCGARRAGGSG